jgi:hypothetical protein
MNMFTLGAPALIAVLLNTAGLVRSGAIEVPVALKDLAELEVELNVEPGMNERQIFDLVSDELGKVGINARSTWRRKLIITVRSDSSAWNQSVPNDPTAQCSLAVSVVTRVVERVDIARGDHHLIREAPVAVWTHSTLRMALLQDRDATILAVVKQMLSDFVDVWRRAQLSLFDERKPCIQGKDPEPSD